MAVKKHYTIHCSTCGYGQETTADYSPHELDDHFAKSLGCAHKAFQPGATYLHVRAWDAKVKSKISLGSFLKWSKREGRN